MNKLNFKYTIYNRSFINHYLLNHFLNKVVYGNIAVDRLNEKT